MPIASADTVLAERTLTPDMVRYIRGRSDARIVFTFDDAYTKLPGYAGALAYWRGVYKGVKKFREVLKMTDLNITPSRVLNDLYSKNAAPFEYVPNFLSPLRWETKEPKEAPARDTVTLGGGFSLYHQESFRDSGLADALRQTCSKLNIKIVLYGGDASTFQSLKVRRVPFSYRKHVSWYDWPDTVRQEIDVMLAPLAGGYDLYRSTLRLDEAGAAMKPFIASMHGPYTGERLGGLYVCNTKSEWCEAIEQLVKDEKFRRMSGELGYGVSKERFMDKNVGVYERLLNV